MIKLITFDLDNTLWPVENVILKATHTLYAWIEVNAPKLSARFTNRDLLSLSQEFVTQYPHFAGDFSKIRKETIRIAASRSGYSESKAQEISEHAFTVFINERNKVTFFEGVIDTLEQLAKDYPLIAISNGNADLEAIGLKHYFVQHYKAGGGLAAKPHAEMFILAREFCRVKAAETLHIGDDFECDVRAAHQLGFKTIYADMMKEHNQKAIAMADATISTIQDIPKVLESF